MKRMYYLLFIVLSLTTIISGCNDSKIKRQKAALENNNIAKEKQQPKNIDVKFSKEVIDLSDDDFNAYISKGVTLVDFWAVWCRPCRTQGPIVDEVAQELGETAHICKMNVDSNKVIPARFRITSIPTIIIFKDGRAVKQLTGIQTKRTLIDLIKSHI